MNTAALFDLLLTVMGYAWTLIWVSVSLLGVTVVGALIFVFLESMPQRAVPEIKRRNYMGYSQKNASRRNAKLEKRTSLEQRRKENLVDGWEILKRQRDGLRKSFSKQSWLSHMKAKIKKEIKAAHEKNRQELIKMGLLE